MWHPLSSAIWNFRRTDLTLFLWIRTCIWRRFSLPIPSTQIERASTAVCVPSASCVKVWVRITLGMMQQTATAIYRGITVQVPVNSTQITIDGQAVELTYVTYDQNGDEITLPNPTEPSELEQDVLVDVGTICDAWKVGAVWNGVSDGENTVDQGLIILP